MRLLVISTAFPHSQTDRKSAKTYSTLPGIEHLSFNRLVWVTVNRWEVKLCASFEVLVFVCYGVLQNYNNPSCTATTNYETTYTISGQEDDYVQIVGRNLVTIIYNSKGEAGVKSGHVMPSLLTWPYVPKRDACCM